LPAARADPTACCGSLVIRCLEWRPWPHRYRVCAACGFEVDAAGWPVQDPGFAVLR